jgi:hypothetical protein
MLVFTPCWCLLPLMLYRPQPRFFSLKTSYLVSANELFKNPSGCWAEARAVTA